MRYHRLFLVVLIAFFLFSCQKNSGGVVEVGHTAPDFKTKTLDGKYISLSDYKDKVVLIEFWATWCPPCRASIPEMETLHKKFIDQDFVLIGVNVDEGENVTDRVRAFVNQYNVTYTIVLDNEGRASRKYGVMSIPAIYLLDRNHKIVKKYLGFSPGLGEELARQIEALL